MDTLKIKKKQKKIRQRAPKGSKIYKIGGKDSVRTSFYVAVDTLKKIDGLCVELNCTPNSIIKEAVERTIRIKSWKRPLINAVKLQLKQKKIKRLHAVK